jgi:F0F1-type ATP synthase assembly protein I
MRYTNSSKHRKNIGYGLRRNKKADVVSIIYILVFLFLASIGALIFHYTWGKMADAVTPAFNSSGGNVSNYSEEVNTIMQKSKEATNILDYVFLVVFVGSIIGMILTSFTFNSHPAFFILFVIILVITVILASVFSNAYETVEEKSIFNETKTHFPITSFIMDKLPLWIIVIGFTSILIIYAKSRYREELNYG